MPSIIGADRLNAGHRMPALEITHRTDADGFFPVSVELLPDPPCAFYWSGTLETVTSASYCKMLFGFGVDWEAHLRGKAAEQRTV
jgi:hypothetical protein